MESCQEIKFEIENEIARITLNRPDIRNAITGPEIIREIESACREVNANRMIKVLIITGKDPAFSSGGNIKDMQKREGMFGGTPAEIMENYRANVQRIPLAVTRVEIPTIAAVNSFDNVILIAGGQGKGADFSPLYEPVKQRVKRLILIGEDREKIAAVLNGATEKSLGDTFEDAIGQARKAAQPAWLRAYSGACGFRR